MIRVDRDDGTARQRQVALKFVQELIRSLTIYDGVVEIFEAIFFSLGKALHCLIRLLVLQVGFAVEIFRFHIGDTLRERTSKHEHVTGEELILGHFDDAADLNVLRLRVNELVCSSRHTLCDHLVLFIILFAPLIVFKCILDHGDADHESQWHERGCCAIEILETWNALQDSHEEEVEIGHLAELFEEIFGQKRHAGVFGSRHTI